MPPPEPPPAALYDYLRVVIVGAGFAGLACAANLGGTNIRVTVIDRQNYHLFVPLLYQVATAALSPADIAEPVRKILSRYWNIDVMLAEVTGVDPGRRAVLTAEGKMVKYDRRVIATGSRYSYFGHDDWAELTRHSVEKIEPGGVTMNGRFVPTGTVIWGAGVEASPAGRWLGVETDRSDAFASTPVSVRCGAILTTSGARLVATSAPLVPRVSAPAASRDRESVTTARAPVSPSPTPVFRSDPRVLQSGLVRRRKRR